MRKWTLAAGLLVAGLLSSVGQTADAAHPSVFGSLFQPYAGHLNANYYRAANQGCFYMPYAPMNSEYYRSFPGGLHYNGPRGFQCCPEPVLKCPWW